VSRVGLFGGTFDPPHSGHVAVAGDVADRLRLDRVLWIPAGEPPHKPASGVSPASDRLEMVREAVRADPRFEVSTVEIDRPGPSYMVDTVRALRSALPEAELYLIIGADELQDFGSWRAPDEIVRHVRLAVMDRAGDPAEAHSHVVPKGAEAIFVPVRRVDVSSTEVRADVRAGRDPGDKIPPGVAAVIEREGLYSAA